MASEKTPLRKLREARGLTQEDVAVKLGMDYSTYGKIETGYTSNPRREPLEAITNFFGPAITVEMIIYPERFPDYAVLPEHVA